MSRACKASRASDAITDSDMSRDHDAILSSDASRAGNASVTRNASNLNSRFMDARVVFYIKSY